MCYSWKIVRNQFACMVVLQSTRKGPNHCLNFMYSGSDSATNICTIYYLYGLFMDIIISLVTLCTNHPPLICNPVSILRKKIVFVVPTFLGGEIFIRLDSPLQEIVLTSE